MAVRWLRFAPGRFQKLVFLRQTGALEAYAGSSIPVPHSAGGRHELRVPQLTQVDGVIEARETDLPLVVRQARGFGQVVFLAADPELAAAPPVAGTRLLLGKLLDNPPAAAPRKWARAGPSCTTAIPIWPGNCGVRWTSSPASEWSRSGSWWALIGVYIFLIGPGDYLLLRKVLRRMQWTWLTFSAGRRGIRRRRLLGWPTGPRDTRDPPQPVGPG